MEAPATTAQTRIQKENSARILEAALDVFSTHGYSGATLDLIARGAGLSKPNLLYYFPSKQAIYGTVLAGLMKTWLDPLRTMDPEGDPIAEIIAYVQRKLEMSRLYPRESRLFANEILQGAPRIMDQIQGELRELVEEKATLIERWQAEGKLVTLDARHLIFSIWATTQHYADFDVQVRGILAPTQDHHFNQADQFLSALYRGALTPKI
ncbi:TetR family transcriptional regulator C-terminal domain-containing protein [Oceaniglobus ichthyenteri]|uniref:TetR family transcriptional regulator C-terminal domain-containing protein n=1 Tax=Oceaniglobus ichthyenteri TaxID=2136177 RepID=UPI000D3491A4|nr:TetR family transcriptional regulator C-terminal domain-containing protein [Oceaniglobus ichthyenteri]